MPITMPSQIPAGELVEVGGVGAAAAYASTVTGHGHTMATGDTASDPSPRPWPNEGEKGSLTSNKGTEKSWPARNGQGSSIAKEHGRRPGRDGQEVRPSTPDSGPRR